jgi:RNAse (barnase) inhibitor barstar
MQETGKKKIIIDGDDFSDPDGFYEEMNRLFMKGVDWRMGHSLDALNDVLYGGFGVYEPGEPVLVLWRKVSGSRKVLGTEETKRNYQMKIDQGYPYNVTLFKQKLAAIEDGTGPTLFDIIIEIFRDHKNIELRLED